MPLLRVRADQPVHPFPAPDANPKNGRLLRRNAAGFCSAVDNGRYVTFQLAEVAVPRTLFAEILRLIEQLRPEPAPT